MTHMTHIMQLIRTPQMKLALAVLVIAGSAFSVSGIGSAADPMILGPEGAVVVNAPDQRAQTAPDIAADGNGTYLVVWQQGQKFYKGANPVVLATRLDASGSVLDADPIRLCSSSGAQELPRVRFSNGVFLVTWQDFRNNTDWDVYATRVSPDGSVLDDGEGQLIAGGAHNQALPDLAVGPDGFLVVWQDFRDNARYRPYAAHIGTDGVVVEPGGVLLADGNGVALTGGSLSVVRAGSAWFMKLSQSIENYAVRLDDDLTALETVKLPSLMGAKGAGRFFGDGERALYAVTFQAGHGGPVNPGAAAMFNEGSAVALPNPNVEAPDAGLGADGWATDQMIVLRDAVLGAQGNVGAAFDGTKYLVAMRGYHQDGTQPEARQLGIMRLGADGVRIDAEDAWTLIHDGSAPGGNPVVAANAPEDFMVVYEAGTGPSGLSRLVARQVTAH